MGQYANLHRRRTYYPALDLVHGEIGKGYRVLVTATRD
jgi:hypothetical protein